MYEVCITSVITPILQISSALRVKTRKLACDGDKIYFWFILEPHNPQLSKSCFCLSEVSTEEWKYPKCRGQGSQKRDGIKWGKSVKKEGSLDQPGLILKQSYFNSLSRNSVPLFISVLTKEKPSELIIINISLKTNPYFLWWWHGHSTSSGSHFTRLEKKKQDTILESRSWDYSSWLFITLWVPTEPPPQRGRYRSIMRRQTVPVPWAHTPVSITWLPWISQL